jgi:hypothetical protein
MKYSLAGDSMQVVVRHTKETTATDTTVVKLRRVSEGVVLSEGNSLLRELLERRLTE